VNTDQRDYRDEPEYSPKGYWATGLICFFFGTTGAHRFFVGKFVSGGIMLGLFLSSYIIHPKAAIVSLIWCLIDLITISSSKFKDGKGLPIVNESKKH
jgi:TM2 domain-containing membrane protein YozV